MQLPLPLSSCRCLFFAGGSVTNNQILRMRTNGLTSLGFKDYLAYLSSDLWKKIRRIILGGSSNCRICKVVIATQVHHQDYSLPVLLGENLGPLIVVCAGCHRQIEFSGERKRSFLEARRRCAHLLMRGAIPRRRKQRMVKRKPTGAPGPHPCRTPGCSNLAKGGQQRCGKCIRLRVHYDWQNDQVGRIRAVIDSLTTSSIVLSEELLFLGAGRGLGGWTRAQLTLLGIDWGKSGPSRGWTSSVIGAAYSSMIIREFLKLRLDRISAI